MAVQSKLASASAASTAVDYSAYSISALYIPRVHRNQMHDAYIKRVFESQQIAVVSRVDFAEYEHPDANFCFAVVHIQFWIHGIISKHFRERIQSQREARIVYSDPSYWVILPYIQKQKKQSIRAEATLETATTAAATDSCVTPPPPPSCPISSYRFAPPPFAPDAPPRVTVGHQNKNCICGCGGSEPDCSSQILYNTFTDSTWKPISTPTTSTAESNWNMEDNFRFHDYDRSSIQSAY
jgi:hypothetical protein